MQILAPWLYPNCNTRPDNVENEALTGGASKCRLCQKGPVRAFIHMIKLTEARELAPDGWVRPDEER
jgi:hypothetical protein